MRQVVKEGRNLNTVLRKIPASDFWEYDDCGNKNPFIDPMHKLWACVILQAMTDAREGLEDCKYENTQKMKDRREAIALFDKANNPKSDLQELCDLAGVPLSLILLRYNDPNFCPKSALRIVSNAEPKLVDNKTLKKMEGSRIRSARYRERQKSNTNLAN